MRETSDTKAPQLGTRDKGCDKLKQHSIFTTILSRCDIDKAEGGWRGESIDEMSTVCMFLCLTALKSSNTPQTLM